MSKAIYPGSFDPMTYGHLDIIKRASTMFDELTVCILNNTSKTPLFSVEDRVKIMKDAVADLPNVKVDSFEGLTINYAKSKGAKILIRGLRAVSDFEFEMQLSQSNTALDSEIKTIFLTTRPKYNFISSSTVKEVYKMGGDVSKFVPEPVISYLKK